MSYREWHVKEAEKLLEGARDDARAFLALTKDEQALVENAIRWRRAQFAVDAAHVHAELALVTPHDPNIGAVGGYA